MSEILSIIERMKESSGVSSESELAKYLNLKSSSAVSTWKLRDRTPYKECAVISEREGVSMDWLLYGKDKEPSNASMLDMSNIEIIHIKEYEVELSAGSGSYPQEHPLVIDERPFPKKWLTSKGLDPDAVFLTRVSGDSMEPVLKDKDIVMINTAQKTPNDAMPFAVRVDDSLYIKRVLKQGNHLKLISLNPLFTPLDVDLNTSHCEIIGAIVWHAHSWI